MKTLSLVKYGPPESAFECRQAPDPEPKDGEVLINVEAFGINFADVLARQGLYPDATRLPFVPGYEVVGRIGVLGRGVTGLDVDERVVAFTRFGGYAEAVCAHEAGVTSIPENMANGVAAALATQYCTAYYAAYEATNLFPGDRVLVNAAAGGVGTALVQLAKLKGCEVFGTAGSDDKMPHMRKIGVDHAINYRTSDFGAEIRRILNGKTLDVAFDSLGGKTYKTSNSLLGSGGRMVSFGVAEVSGRKGGIFNMLKLAIDFGLMHPISLLTKSRAAIGVNMLRLADDKPQVLSRCLKAVVQLAAEGKLQPQVAAVYDPDRVAEAHQVLEGRTSIGKIIVAWRPGKGH